MIFVSYVYAVAFFFNSFCLRGLFTDHNIYLVCVHRKTRAFENDFFLFIFARTILYRLKSMPEMAACDKVNRYIAMKMKRKKETHT